MSERRAVVIGINSYKDPRVVPNLKGAENDAREVFARLRNFGEFTVDRSKHLLLGEKATCDNIRKAISDLFWKKDPCDIAVLYFSGHGFLDDYGNGYIAPWDHEYSDPLVHGIRMQELRNYFLAENNKTQALLILDCCHSGVTAQVVKDVGAVELSGRFYDSLTNDMTTVIGSGKFILASSGADETSREMCAAHTTQVLNKTTDELKYDDLEPHDHGVMTYHLLEGMNGQADDGKEVRIGRLYEYVSRKMTEYKERDDSPKDTKVYDCVWSTYAEGPASQTWLVKAPRKSEINDLIQQGRERVEEGGAYSLFQAIRCVDSVLTSSPTNSDAQKLVSEIDKKLSEYKEYAVDWFMNHKQEYMLTSYKEEFRELRQVASNLCFDRLRQLENNQAALVGTLISLARKEENDEGEFKDYLSRAPFTKARDKEGSAKIVVKPGGAIQ